MFDRIDPKQIKGNDILQRLKDSVYLKKEEYTAMSKAVIEAPEESLVLLNAFPIEKVDQFKQKYEYTNLNKYGDAEVMRQPSDFPAMKVDGVTASVDIPFKGISFILNKFDIQNSRKLGQKLNVVSARVAGEKVKKLIDECLYNKSTIFGTLGAYGQATGTYSGSDWTSLAADAIHNAVVAWVDTIPAAYQQDNMRLLLNKTQFAELNKMNAYGITAMKKIKETFPGLKILRCRWVTAGTGLLYPFNSNVLRRVVAMPVRGMDWKNEPFSYTGVSLESDILVMPATAAVVKGSSI